MNLKKIILLLVAFILDYSGAFSQACDCYVTVDSTNLAEGIYQIVPMTLGTDTGGPPNYHCNNCSSQIISLPFNFCFYGTEYNTVYINNKGNISFVNPEFKFSSNKFPLGNDTAMIAPFYADICDTPPFSSSRSFADIYCRITSTHMIVQWNMVGYQTFDDDLFDNFQLIITNGADTILPPGNNVSFCYYLMQWASGDSSGGSMGFGGKPAIIGVNKGDGVHYAQFGTFDFPGNAYDDPFDTNSGAYWLNGKNFTFNTCVTGNTIPPVIINPDSCDKLTICAGDTLKFAAFFLCPQHGQTATLSASAPGLSGLTSTTGVNDSIYHIVCQLTASLSDTGTHVITLTATDNSSPPLTNSKVYTVTIQKCDSAAGIRELAINTSPVTIFPNPNNGKFTMQMVNGEGSLINDEIQVYNILGEMVYSQFSILNSPLSIDLSSQPAGIYFYLVIAKNGNLIGDGKFVIE